MKTRISILAAVIICLMALHYFCGLFTPYNYLTAKLDILNENPTILIYGYRNQADKQAFALAPVFGFRYKRIANCNVYPPMMNGAEQYNEVTMHYLDKKLGTTWKQKFDYQVDSLFTLSRTNR